MAFAGLVAQASQTFPNLVSIVAGGVIGDGIEHDEPSVPCMALLTGSVPMRHGAGGRVRWFEFNEMHRAPPPPDDPFWQSTIDASSSYLLFADPWSPLESVLSAMRGTSIVGGISVPTGPGSTIAINDRHLPQGSLVAVEWPGEVVQVVVAQGCSPIGKPFTVTAVKGNTIAELDGQPAVEAWNNVLQGIQSPSARSSVVCGIRIDRRDRRAATVTNDTSQESDDDYLIRQIIGRTTTSGLVVAGRVRVGDTIRFHIRDASAARSDLHLMMSRAAAERLWHAPPILAALQISCVARGRFLFGSSNIDIEETARLCGGSTAVGGFFANGELGPVGLSGFSGTNEATDTFLHGFTTVVALLCGARTRADPTTSTAAAVIEQRIDAWS
jgi:small ligand-binding sensory domain FIST